MRQDGYDFYGLIVTRRIIRILITEMVVIDRDFGSVEWENRSDWRHWKVFAFAVQMAASAPPLTSLHISIFCKICFVILHHQNDIRNKII